MLGSRRTTIFPAAENSFNYITTKVKVIRLFNDTAPPAFKKFYGTTLFDRLAHTCILYFVAKFQHECLKKSMEKVRKQHLDGVNQRHLEDRCKELEVEAEEFRQAVAPVYAEVLMKHSTYNKPHQDRLFFEHLYDSLIELLDEAFVKLDKRQQVEEEIGSLFRSRHFNLYERRNLPPRSVDTLSVKELYSIKNETLNRALNAKLLSSLYDKPPVLEVQTASLTHTPLIEGFMRSPLVARSKTREKSPRPGKPQLVKSPTSSSDKQSSALNSPGGVPSAKNTRRTSTLSTSGVQRSTSGTVDLTNLLHDDNLNCLDEIKRSVQSTLYTEISPVISAVDTRRFLPTRSARSFATSAAGE